MATLTIKDLMQDALQPAKTTRPSKLTAWKPDLDDYDPSLKRAKAACEAFVADMERGMPPYWLTLIGVTGCGKTRLLRQVFKEAKRINPGNPANNRIWPPDWTQFDPDCVNIYTDSRPYCLFYDEQGLADRMRHGDYQLPESLKPDYFVAVDEIGVARDPTNFISEAIGRVAECRLGRWSMFASNFSLQEISERMDARIASRMIRDENKVVSITAGDYALKG